MGQITGLAAANGKLWFGHGVPRRKRGLIIQTAGRDGKRIALDG
ncbi:hypothetical protein NP564_24210 [Vibrio parahaemolyticus]|nr:hypothetical protein [Vibrio parahaemolyticus]